MPCENEPFTKEAGNRAKFLLISVGVGQPGCPDFLSFVHTSSGRGRSLRANLNKNSPHPL